jgi:beta-ureidopropionase / N-carbamoyl-L-amino-acid hydrolase
MLVINPDRLLADLESFAGIGADPQGGITRLAYSEADLQARRRFVEQAEAAGLVPRTDAVGNIFARRPGREAGLAPVGFGSHLDSVPNGGRFDGPLGALAALEVVRSLSDAGMTTRRPIDVICFAAEESGRFGLGTLGSKALVGKLTPEMLDSLQDPQGQTVRQVLQACGFDPAKLEQARLRPGDYHAYLELHLEQGAVLESRGLPVGIVTGIAAPTRYRVTYTGRADHSGATPMDLRKDALVAAAELVLAVRTLTVAYGNPTTVGTVGILRVQPGAMNVIPGEVTMGIDIRDIEAEGKRRVAMQVRAAAERIAREGGLEVAIEPLADDAPVPLPARIRRISAAACRARGIPCLELPSGAGHDAMYMAEVTEVGMLFTRCREGISHNPAEYVSPEDVIAGATALAETVLRLAEE